MNRGPAVPNYAPPTPTELARASKEERAYIAAVEACRQEIIAALTRLPMEAPIAAADFALIVLSRAKAALGAASMNPADAENAIEPAMTHIRRALAALVLETAAELGHISAANLITLRGVINDTIMAALADAIKEQTPTES